MVEICCSANERLLTPDELSELISVSTRTLKAWRLERRGPQYFRLEGQVRYKASMVEDWLQARLHAA